MFTIQCTTCDAKLAVKNEELIGQILACPKCGGMVLVERPQTAPVETAAPEISVSKNEPKPSFKRFPDMLSETESGIMDRRDEEKTADTESPSTTVSPPPPPPSVALSESEIKTRKILLGGLVGLLALILLAVGALIALKGETRPDSSEPDGREATVKENDGNSKSVPVAAVPKNRGESGTKNTTENGYLPNGNVEPETQSGKEENTSIDNPTGKISEEQPVSVKPGLDELLALTPKQPEDTPITEDEIPDEEDSDPNDSPEIRTTTDLLSDIQRKLPGLVESQALLNIDIPDRLRRPVVGMKLNRTPLIVALRTISALTEIPMTLDVDEFRARGIAVDRPMTETFPDGTFGDLLTGILAPLKLEPVIEDRQILITVPEERRNAILERTFDVSDLVAGTKDAVDSQGNPVEDARLTPQGLRDILRRLIDPVGFAETPDHVAPADTPKTDRPSIRIDGNSLVVRHRLRMLDESLRILEQLRVLRGLPQKTEVEGENLVPEAFGWDAVDRPLTLNYYQPVLLSEILHRIETATGLRILVDHKALHRALTPLYTIRATVRCDQGTINDALENLLASVDDATLNYRIVGPNAVEITTWDAARKPEKMSVEVHRYQGEDSPEEFVRTVKTVFDPDGWFDADDPESVGLGDVVVDRPSGCFFVRQSQPIQRQLRRHAASLNSSERTPAPQKSAEDEDAEGRTQK